MTGDRQFALEVVRRLREAGFEALWAGGCVRDEILGLVPKDYDVATSALPEQVRRVFRRTVPVGESFLVVEVLGPRTEHGHIKVQVATFRTDGDYHDGRRPSEVRPATPQEDAQRRDFTINGLFFDPEQGRVLDFVGGQADLDRRVLRAIGDARARIAEDRLRLLRAVRMAARFELSLDPDTTSAIVSAAPGVTTCSAERIAEELRKILVDRHRARALRLMMDLGLAGAVLPEVLPMRGLPQGLPGPDSPALPPPGRPGPSVASMGDRVLDLWEHVLRVLDHLGEQPSFPLAFAALLHDVGKPRTVGRTPERYTFHGHEHVGRRMAAEIGKRLKLANDERARVEWLVEKHQILADVARMRASTLKPLLVHPGIDELFRLHRADALASNRPVGHVEQAERLRDEWAARGELDPPPLITGDILVELGLKPGPVFKTLLDAAREAQLEGSVTTPEQARELVLRLLEAGEGAGPEARPERAPGAPPGTRQ